MPEEARQPTGVHEDHLLAGRDLPVADGSSEAAQRFCCVDRVEDETFAASRRDQRVAGGGSEKAIARSDLIGPHAQRCRRDARRGGPGPP